MPPLTTAHHLPSPLLTTGEAAAYLRRSPETLRYWRQRDEGPPWVRSGRRVYYRADELVAFVEALEARS